MGHQDIAIAAQPGTTRRDYFAIAPDQSVVYLAPGFGPWVNLGGLVTAIDAEWIGDGSGIELIGVGLDGKIWRNLFPVAVGAWSGWSNSEPLHTQLVEP
jgi:hypothetical protein